MFNLYIEKHGHIPYIVFAGLLKYVPELEPTDPLFGTLAKLPVLHVDRVHHVFNANHPPFPYDGMDQSILNRSGGRPLQWFNWWINT